jgi:hypothetical protein
MDRLTVLEHILMMDTFAGGTVQLMQGHLAAALGGGYELDRNCHQRDSDLTGPERVTWHVIPLD